MKWPLRSLPTGIHDPVIHFTHASLPSLWLSPGAGLCHSRAMRTAPSVSPARVPTVGASLSHLHVAAVDGAAAQHQQVGVGIVGAEPLLGERQQLGHAGQVEQGWHTVRDTVGFLLEENSPRREVPGAHGSCSRRMWRGMKAGERLLGTARRTGLSLEEFGVQLGELR